MTDFMVLTVIDYIPDWVRIIAILAVIAFVLRRQSRLKKQREARIVR